MKKLIKSILVLILLVLIIPQVSAKEVTTTYTNYYFFLKPYQKYEINDKSNLINSSDTTTFPHLELGYKGFKEAKVIPLKSTCSKEQEKKEECWSYKTYYEKYKKAKNGTIQVYINNKNQEDSATYYQEGTKFYYTHGSYKNSVGDFVKSEGKIDDYAPCASVYLNSNIKVTETNKEYIKVEVNRTINDLPSTSDVNWDYDWPSSANVSACPTGITAVDYLDKRQIFSPLVYKYEYTVTENKCDVDKPESDELSCNGSSKTLESSCEKLTIKTADDVVDVKINQKGIVSNILTPTTLYAGGGFKFGILYTNTITWNYVNSSGLSNSDKDNVTKQMQNKLKNVQEIIDNLTLDIKFGENILDSNFFVKECKQKGSFTAGNTLTTVCEIYLPASEIEDYTGKVTYRIGDIGNGINNKYYTNLIDNGNYSITGTLSGLSVLNNRSSTNDSGTTGSWTGNWSVELNDCNINIYSLLQLEDGRYNFIYRPIDINNPFPNRNAGINWFDWYNNIRNKQRIEETYKNLNYTVELDNKTISDIKEYNKDKTYFDFDTMDKDESTFLRKYFPNAKVGGS